MAEPTPAQGPMLNLEKIYVKDVSYEAPNAPQVFLEQSAPQVEVQLNIAHSAFNAAQGMHEVVLTVTVTAKLTDKNMFLVELQQAGLFRLNGVPDKELPLVLEIACPNILLPFAREAVNELVGKGGFPQLLINPVNFEMLYQQKQAALQQRQASH
ncbi:MAG TPA: protein-export chaperone SecB [Acidiferrobacterales bacterium]|jgi:preprotein translocase subunit SecB